jgi:hypothetical protein
MATNLASITPYLKEVYTGKIREQLNQEITALKRITRSTSGVTNETGGRYVTFPVHTRRNSGIGSRLEGEALPTPGQQGTAAARVGLKYGYSGVQLSGQSISLSDTDSKAFAKAVDFEMSGLKNDIKKDMNRQIYGNGDGTIGVVKTVVTSTTIPVTDARLFQIGEVVDLITLPSTVVQAARTVNSIDLTTGANTVTVSGAAITTVVGQIFARNGSGPSASGNRELTGLNAIISTTGVLYNIDPAVEPEWTSEVNSNAGTPRALSEGLMTQMADRVRTRGGTTSVILQSLGTRRAYANLLMQQRQVVNEQKFTGGFSGLAFVTDKGEIPVVADVDAPLSTQYFVNEDTLTYYHDEDWHFLDRNGSMWQQVRDTNGDYDAWYARMIEYHELGCDTRNSNGKITDLTEG